MNKLDKLISEKEEFDNESKNIIDSLVFAKNELGKINAMKQGEGWKILENKIREELLTRISFLTKDDAHVNILLALLNLADTKSISQSLEEEITKLLPEQ